MTARLRIQHIIVQPVLVFDDGEELTPGPELQAVALPLSKMAEFIEQLPGQVTQLEAKLSAESESADGDSSE